MKPARRIAERRDFDLACLGIIVVDVFGKTIDRFPDKGTSEYFETLEMHPGGCAYNTGVDAGRLGLRVSVLGKLGHDWFGDYVVQALDKEGVDRSGVCRSYEASTAFSFIMVPPDGQRRIYHTPGVNSTYGLTDVPRGTVQRSRILHVAGASLLPALDGEPTVALLRFARANGVQTSLDPVVQPGIGHLILPCLPYLDVFLPNYDESLYITGLKKPEDQLRLYIDGGVKLAGIKLGAEGSLIGDGKDTIRLGIYDVRVIDTCGAGDAFVAGFLYGVLQNWDTEMIGRFATAAAAFCVQAIGATTAMPPAPIILDFMEKNEISVSLSHA